MHRTEVGIKQKWEELYQYRMRHWQQSTTHLTRRYQNKSHQTKPTYNRKQDSKHIKKGDNDSLDMP